MAIIRTFDNSEGTLNYVGTLSFFCAVSCTIIMLRFRGFKATFNISKNKQNNIVHYDESPGVSLTGAYRANKDELFDNINYSSPSKKITPTPAMVSLPAAPSGHRKDISKSTNNLAQPTEKIHKTKSTPNIPQVVPEPLTKTQIKEAKKLEKSLLDERKKQAKIAAKEQEKAEKMRKEREKLKLIMKTKAEETKSKRTAPQPQPAATNRNQPKTENVQAVPAVASRSERQPTDTLESISKSSGPPPYTPPIGGFSTPKINNTSDKSDNIWEMVSQHRQQINRPQVVSSLPKQTHLDLNYDGGSKSVTDNSDA